MIRNGQPDADDLFADTRMSFGDHIEDLRKHLWRAIIGFFVAMVLSFTFSWWVLHFIMAPIEKALVEVQDRRIAKYEEKIKNDPTAEKNKPQPLRVEINRSELAQLIATILEKPFPTGVGEPEKDAVAGATLLAGYLNKLFPAPKEGEEPLQDWVPLTLRQRPTDVVKPIAEDPSLVVYKIQEGMMVYLEVSMICGLVLGSPWIFYQLWSFVAAGLYANEKRLVHVYMPFSLALFLAGVFVCEFMVLPQAIRFLLEFNEWLGVKPELRLEDWLSFALLVPVLFGLSFQTPLVMLFLAKIGIFDANSFRSKRRIAWFGLMVVAALVMPTTDPWTILMMQAPMIALYEVGILLAAYVDRQRKEEEVPDDEEMVGV